MFYELTTPGAVRVLRALHGTPSVQRIEIQEWNTLLYLVNDEASTNFRAVLMGVAEDEPMIDEPERGKMEELLRDLAECQSVLVVNHDRDMQIFTSMLHHEFDHLMTRARGVKAALEDFDEAVGRAEESARREYVRI